MFLNKFSSIIRSALLAGMTMASAAASAEVVDVLVLYTPQALNTRSGADINARISSYIAYANTAYKNSQVDLQLRLVGAKRVDVPYERVTEANLSSFSRDTMVAGLREETGADLVTLLNLRQEVSGGYVCGIGYIPQGQSSTGKFYSNAAAAGFSLVGIDCGIDTFAHELGHNMGLGHSAKQNSPGGVWPWARGYGVDGLFSTVMAYPQSFGTTNQLPVFSNPNIFECVDLACGMDRNLTNGADSAASLVALGAQIAAFRPTRVELPSLPGVDDGGDLPLEYCPAPSLSNNLLQNGEFDSLEAWQSGSSSLQIEAFAKGDCLENKLVVSGRTSYSSGATQILTRPLQARVNYQFKGEFAVRGSSRETVRVALRVRTTRGSYYLYLNPVSATPNEMTQLNQSFAISSGQVDAVVVYGPPAGVEIVMDRLAVVPAQ